MAEEDTEYLKLPIEERCVHKSWKARQSGFEESAKLFARLDGEDPAWKKYSPIVKKFCSESNAIVLESGLEATLSYVSNCDASPKSALDIMDGIVSKCLGAPKAKTKELAKQVCLQLCEVEAQEKVIEELIKGLTQKNPKTVAGCLTTMTDILRAFGAKVIKVSPFLKAAIPLLDHRDKSIRDEGKLLIIESYRWVGDLMKQQLNGVKPVQMTELEEEFQKVTEAGKAKPERYLKSQQPLMAQGQNNEEGGEDVADGGAEDKDGGNEEEETDAFDLMDPVDIIPKLPKNFHELIEEKKWQLRKEALDALLPLSQTAKIENNNDGIGDLVRALKKVVAKDTNVMLVAQAAQCLTGLAKGLRANFKSHASQLLSVLLDKYKEKKVNVVSALSEALDAMYPCMGIEVVQEETLAALKHKTPSVNSETAKFLARSFSRCPPQLVTNKKVTKGYVCALLEKLSHPDVTVRDAASEALGVLLKFLGESNLGKLLIDVDSIKMAKIKEFEEKAVLTGKPASAAAAGQGKAKVVKPDNNTKAVKPGGAKVVKPKPTSAPAKKPVVSKQPARQVSISPEPEDDPEDLDVNNALQDQVPRVDISEKVSNETFLAKLNDKDWKLRKEAMDDLKETITSAKFVKANVGGLSPALAARFSDKNKIISVMAVEVAKDLALAMGPHVKGQLSELLPPLLSSLSDNKPTVRQSVVSCMETILDQTLLRDFFADEMIISALNKGNPSTKQELFKFLACHLPDAKGINKDDLNGCLTVLFSSIEDRNAEVRKSAQDSVESFMRHLGYAKMSAALDRCKPGTKSVILPMLDKARENVPAPEPQRKGQAKSATTTTAIRGGSAQQPKKLNLVSSARPNTAKASSSSSSSSSMPMSKKKGEDVDASPPYVASNLKNARFKDEVKLKILKWNFTAPRQEFVDQLKEQMAASNFNKTLVSQLFHADFKQHLKAIDTLSNCVSSDVEALSSNLDLILKWMTLRFFETNPQVLLKCLEYLQDVFCVLADDSYHMQDLEASSFVPYLLVKIGDPKDPVRNSVKSIIKSIIKVYPASKVATHLMNGLTSKNAKQRSECLDELGCLVSGFGSSVLQQPSVGACLKEIAKQIADRDNSVRNAALNCMTEVYFQDGEKMYKAIGGMPDKDMAMLEERIKRQAKTRPAPNFCEQQQQPQQQQQMRPQSRLPSAPGATIPSAGGVPRPKILSSNGNHPPSTRNNQSPAKARPNSAIFALDFNQIESAMDGIGDSGLRLVNHNLDDIFNDEPVRLPTTMTGNRQMQQQVQQTQQQQPLDHMPEAYEALDLVLAQIFNQDSTTCINALVQLDELMKHKEKVGLLGKRMDQLFVACYMQYRHVLTTKMNDNNADPREVMRLFQYLTMALMSAFHHEQLTKKASASSLHDLVHIIMCILLEPAVESLPDGGQLIRALNILTVKIVERSDHTNVTSAFLKLLKEGIGNASLSPKYVELIMKCLWKIIRLLPAWISEGENNKEQRNPFSLSIVLSDLHDFLKAFPSTYWRKQESDTPMRTVKTILHTLTKVRGEEIMDHLTRINDPDNSELVAYLRKLLNNGIGKENNNVIPQQQPVKMKSVTNISYAPPTTSPSSRFSKDDHETLAEIFKKIGQKEITKQGLLELYNFKQQNPQADLEPFLAKSSQYFRDYIERGLKSIEHEGSPAGSGKVLLANNSENNSGQQQQQQQQQPFSQYLDRLKKLREQGGLDKSAGVSAYRIAAPSSIATSASAPTFTEDNNIEDDEDMPQQQFQQQQASASDVEDIKKRLERIKHSAF